MEIGNIIRTLEQEKYETDQWEALGSSYYK